MSGIATRNDLCRKVKALSLVRAFNRAGQSFSLWQSVGSNDAVELRIVDCHLGGPHEREAFIVPRPRLVEFHAVLHLPLPDIARQRNARRFFPQNRRIMYPIDFLAVPPLKPLTAEGVATQVFFFDDGLKIDVPVFFDSSWYLRHSSL